MVLLLNQKLAARTPSSLLELSQTSIKIPLQKQRVSILKEKGEAYFQALAAAKRCSTSFQFTTFQMAFK